MEPFIKILPSLMVVLFIESVLADQQSGGNISHRQGSESFVHRRSCPFTTDTEEKTRDLLNSKLNSCLKSPQGTDFMEGLRSAETTDDIQSLFRRFCGKETFVRQCVANVTALSESCLNETQRNVVQIHANFIQLSYEIGCAQGGEKAAKAIVDGWHFNNGSLDGSVHACMHSATNQLVLRGATDVRVVSRQHYRMLNVFKQCIVIGEPQGSSMVNFADVIIRDILKALPCVGRYQETVLCEAIDNQ